MTQLEEMGKDISTLAQGAAAQTQCTRLMRHATLAATYWQQRVRDNQLKFGDVPSKLLFNRLKRRQVHNRLYLLRDSDNNWVDTPTQIDNLILRHFQQLYTPTSTHIAGQIDMNESIDLALRELDLPTVSPMDKEALLKPFASSEIQQALFTMANNKSPGLDGFPVEFFTTHWATMGDLIIQAVTSFLSTGHILQEWNRSLLVLIPKIAAPEEVNHLRPISLCNVIYKCAAKCLVNRMQPLLPHLIDDYQNAFVPGRQMGDSSLISHEILHIINKQRQGNRHLAALKLDMNKAYDRVSWQFILKVLTAYGFPAFWVRLIHQCITTVSYRIMINGVASETFTPQCGLRQGDPLSPYLFLFCMDVFSRMTSLGGAIRKIQGISTRRGGPSISHLFFADDAMFFFKASPTVCANLKGIIDRFCMISGQMVNLQKSFVKFSPNVSTETQLELKTLLSMESKESIGTYLGVSVDINGPKVQHFTPLLDSIASKITGWQHRSLSQPAKLIIINSILVATIMHHLSVFPLPGTIVNKIDSMLIRFFWLNAQSQGIHWRKKEILQLPRGSGGLGIRSIGPFNDALLMKRVWRYHHNPQLLASKTFNICQSTTQAFTFQNRSRSWGSRGLRRAAERLNSTCIWKIGNGHQVSVLKDRWLKDHVPIFKDQVPLRQAAKLRVNELIIGPMEGWNSVKIHQLFQPASAGVYWG